MSIVGSTTAMRSASTSRTEWMKLREMNVDSAVSAPRRGRVVAMVVMSSLRFEELERVGPSTGLRELPRRAP